MSTKGTECKVCYRHRPAFAEGYAAAIEDVLKAVDKINLKEPLLDEYNDGWGTACDRIEAAIGAISRKERNE